MSAATQRIAFVTCEKKPEITDDDETIRKALPAGISLYGLVWSNPAQSFDSFDLLVLRSCWDYHLRHSDFVGWLGEVEAAGVKLLNSAGLVRWNSEKTYLRSLAEAGCDVVPTEWLDAQSLLSDGTDRIGGLLRDRGWSRAVIKPTVSASGLHTWATSPDLIQGQGDRLRDAVAHGDLMLQPFLPEIEAHGEWSLIFFGGVMSHAVLKVAKPGDFRVQSDFGGTAELASPPAALISDAENVMAALPGEPAYARIDGVERNGRLVLVEAELIEPQLFLGLDPEAPRRFAKVLERSL